MDENKLKTQEGSRQIKIAAIISYLSLAVGNIIPLLYTPIMLRMLGQSEYGLYNLAFSVIGYLSLLTFGMGTTSIRYISKYRALGDKYGEEKTIGVFLKLYGGFALLVTLIGFLLSQNLGLVFSKSLTNVEQSKMVILVLILTLNTAFTLMTAVFNSIIISHERFIYSKILSLVSTVLQPLVNLTFLFLGFGSIGLSIAATITNVLYSICNILYCLRKLQIRPQFKKTEKSYMKEIFSFSIFIFIEQIVYMLYWATDKVIIGASIGTSAVAVYSIGATFNSYMQSFSTAISGMLLPKVMNLVTNNAKDEEISTLFIKVGRLQFIIVSFILSAFMVFGKDFILMWAGEDYGQSYIIALMTMIPLFIPLIQNVGLSITQARNKHQFRSVSFIIIAILNVILTGVFVEYWGIIGAAVATCMAYFIGPGFLMNWYYKKKMSINTPLFWNNIFMMSIPVIITVIIGLLYNNFWVTTGFILFFLKAFIYSLVFAGLMYKIGMNEYERDLSSNLIIKILKKLHLKK